MARQHWPEIEDEAWFPEFLRNGMTGFFRILNRIAKTHKLIAPQIRALIADGNHHKVIDLASGGGGMVPLLAQEFESESNVDFTMTDLYPNKNAIQLWNQSNRKNLKYLSTSIDATNVDESVDGIRTVVGSFHHFRPEAAKRVLADAQSKGQPIIVLEGLSRSVMGWLSMVLMPFLVLASMPFVKPFRWYYLLFTYIIPLYPILITWDGIASIMRIYDVEDLNSLVKDLDDPNWVWEIGRFNSGGMPCPYLFGYPKSSLKKTDSKPLGLNQATLD